MVTEMSEMNAQGASLVENAVPICTLHCFMTTVEGISYPLLFYSLIYATVRVLSNSGNAPALWSRIIL